VLLASKSHGVGNTRRWEVDYCRWVENTGSITNFTVTSSSTSMTIGTGSLAPSILGFVCVFYTVGGNLGEAPTVTLTMTDSFGNVKIDTVGFTVVAQ
jgi:hypothetical protein